MKIGHRREIRKKNGVSNVSAFAERIRSDRGVMLETSAFLLLYGGQFTLRWSTQLIFTIPETLHGI